MAPTSEPGSRKDWTLDLDLDLDLETQTSSVSRARNYRVRDPAVGQRETRCCREMKERQAS